MTHVVHAPGMLYEQGEMTASDTNSTGEADLRNLNERFYDTLWRGSRLVRPQSFNTWPLVSSLISKAKRRLEIGPGLRPRLPIEETDFVDLSEESIRTLNNQGGKGVVSSIHDLPFTDRTFSLICALDIIEHVDNDEAAMAEISRVASAGATLLLSTPLHASLWTEFDEFVGHRRRYEPAQIIDLLEQHGFHVSQSAAFGMKPKSTPLVKAGMWFLKNQPDRAMWWYNRCFPLSVRLQKELRLRDGLVNLDSIGEVFLVCKKRPEP